MKDFIETFLFGALFLYILIAMYFKTYFPNEMFVVWLIGGYFVYLGLIMFVFIIVFVLSLVIEASLK